MQGDTVYLYGCECGDRILQVRGDLLASLHAKQRQVVGHNNHENIVWFSMSFKEQLLAANLLARGSWNHHNKVDKPVSLTKNCCFTGCELGLCFPG